MDVEILRMEKISKRFPGVIALDDVTFSVLKGEVHALVGENGAGKSTLMKILTGAYQEDEGTIILRGEKVSIPNTHYAQQLGLSIIYQELNLLPDLSVAQNIFLGREKLGKYRLLDYRSMLKETTHLLNQLGVDIAPNYLIRELRVAQQQMVEIAKALSFNADIVIMDEPTASLSDSEVIKLFEIIRSLKGKGVTIIYISHRLEEIFKIADRATVLKDGKSMGTYNVSELNQEKLVSLMVGRTLSETYPPKSSKVGELLFELKNITVPPILKSVNLQIRRGEVVGLFGLVGAGRSELAKTIFGVLIPTQGEIIMNGQSLKTLTPKKAISSGVGFVPEDRKIEGLCLGLSVKENCTLPISDKLKTGIFISKADEEHITQKYVTELKIKTPSFLQKVKFLSGGNQQKVVLAKWLANDPHFLIFDEPTRGIDVGAKAEIYQIIRELANKGNGILMISSELPEILGMSDRIYVMHDGTIVKEFFSSEAVAEEKIMYYATGTHKNG